MSLYKKIKSNTTFHYSLSKSDSACLSRSKKKSKINNILKF